MTKIPKKSTKKVLYTLVLGLLIIFITAPAFAVIRSISYEEFYDKCYGKWLGEISGCELGATYEFAWDQDPGPYNVGDLYYGSRAQPYFKTITDDDHFLEWGYMYMLRKYGMDINFQELCNAWIALYPPVWLAGANNTARVMMSGSGICPPDSGSRQYNNRWYFIDAQIECEVHGLLYAGNGPKARDQAAFFAQASNDDAAVDAASFYAAMFAYAFFIQDAEKVITKAMTLFPADSYVNQVAQDVLDAYHAHPDDWRATRLVVRDNWRNHPVDADFPSENRDINWSNNFGATLLSLLHGNNDYDRTIQIATLAGWDADCNAGTAGGLMGTMFGAGSIPSKWKDPIRNAYENYGGMCGVGNWDTIRGLGAKSQALAEMFITSNGGTITGEGVNAVYHINTDIQDTDLYTGPLPSVVPTPTATPSGPAQIKNGNFEQTSDREDDVPPYWEIVGFGKFESQLVGYSGRGYGWSEIQPYTEAGIYQLVYGTIPGNRYRLSAKVKTSTDQHPASVRIDPYGGRNCNAYYVEKSTETTDPNWVTLSVEAVAMTDRITCFLVGRTLSTGVALGMQWVIVDEVTLEDLGPSGTPVHSPTPTTPPTNTPGAFTSGDANCDGNVTPGDALLAFQFYMEVAVPASSPCDQFAAADINTDGSITPGDALCIFKLYLEDPC